MARPSASTPINSAGGANWSVALSGRPPRTRNVATCWCSPPGAASSDWTDTVASDCDGAETRRGGSRGVTGSGCVRSNRPRGETIRNARRCDWPALATRSSRYRTSRLASSISSSSVAGWAASGRSGTNPVAAVPIASRCDCWMVAPIGRTTGSGNASSSADRIAETRSVIDCRAASGVASVAVAVVTPRSDSSPQSSTAGPARLTRSIQSQPSGSCSVSSLAEPDAVARRASVSSRVASGSASTTVSSSPVRLARGGPTRTDSRGRGPDASNFSRSPARDCSEAETCRSWPRSTLST